MTEEERKLIKLKAIEEAGVDNWSGYDYAIEIYDGYIKEFEEEK